MKLVVAGGSGFLGRALIAEMSDVAAEIVVLSRSESRIPGARTVLWDGADASRLVEALEGADAVVNYAGAPLLCRWSRAARERILTSRVTATDAIGLAISMCAEPPRLWINGSATGFYGDAGSTMVDETAAPGQGFLPSVCTAWETAATERRLPETVVTLLRTGIVLDCGHPPLSTWLRLTRLFLGGRVGNGRAFVPWIGSTDHARLVRFCIDNPISGPVNAVAPEPVTNGELMAALGRRLHRPAAPPLPAVLVRLAGWFGAPAEAILSSVRADPAAARRAGFMWLAPTLDLFLG